MQEFLKEYKNFLVELGWNNFKATDLYAVDEDGNFTQLIPDGIGEDGRPRFMRVCLVHVDTLSSSVTADDLRKIAQDLAPKAPADKGYNISHSVYAFVINKMIGKFWSRRVNGDIFVFFNGKRFNENEVKFRLWKVVGGLLVKKSERIIESTKEKIRKDPYGYLRTVVDWFKRIGERMYKLAVKNIKPKRKVGVIRDSNSNTNTTSKDSTNATLDRRRSLERYTSVIDEVVHEVEGTILRKLVSSNALKPEVLQYLATTLSSRIMNFVRISYVLGG